MRSTSLSRILRRFLCVVNHVPTRHWVFAAIMCVIITASMIWKSPETDFVQIGTFLVLVITAYLILLYWWETKRMVASSNNQIDLNKRMMELSKMPVFSLELNRKDSSEVHISNIGEGIAFNIRVLKIPMEDNRQQLAVSVPTEPRINKPIDAHYNVIANGHRAIFMLEPDYSGKRIRITLAFQNIFKQSFHWEFEGKQSDLMLVRYSSEPDSKTEDTRKPC